MRMNLGNVEVRVELRKRNVKKSTGAHNKKKAYHQNMKDKVYKDINYFGS